MVDENAPLKNIRLINKKTLFILSVSIVALLLLLLPKRNELLSYLTTSKEPQVAIAFLEALEQQNKTDLPVQLSLALNYNKTGRFQEAIDAVIPFSKFNSEESQWMAKKVYAQASVQKLTQENGSDPQLKKELVLFINQLHSIPTYELAEFFSGVALQTGEPSAALAMLKPHEKNNSVTNEHMVDLALQSNDVDYALALQENEFNNEPNINSLQQLLNLYLIKSDWEKGENILSTYAKSHERSEPYYNAAINFLLSAGHLGQSVILAKERAELFPSEKYYDHASHLYAQKGDIKQATLFLEKAITYDNKKSYLIRLHQYNRWLGEPEKALQVTHLLEQFELNEKQLREGIEEASAIANLESVSHFYHKLGQKGLLGSHEYDKWLDNAEKALGTNKVIEQLESIVGNTLHSTPLLKKLVKFYHGVGEYEKIGQIWENIKSSAPLSFKDVNYYADAYKKIWQPEKSLAVLTSVKDINQADEKYLATISSLAWFVSDKDTLKRIQKLQKIENIDPYVFINAHSPIVMEDSDAFYEFYKKTKDINVIEAFASQALALKDKVKFNEALNLTQLHEGNLPHSFLLLKAQYAMEFQLLEEASTYLDDILKEDDTNEIAVQQLIWLNIQNNNTNELAKIYEKYKVTLLASPNLWSSFAEAANTLERYEEAKHWYLKKINGNKNIPAELLDLANVLEKLNDNDSANIIRKHVATNLTKALFKLPNGDRTYRSLVAIFIGESIASNMVEKSLSMAPTTAKAKELLAYALTEDNPEKVRLLLNSKWLQNYELPASDELKLALLEHNPSKVLQLVEFSLFLTPEERLAALNKIGEKALAWQTGTDALNNQPSSNKRTALMNGLKGLDQQRVTALTVKHTNFSRWNIAQNEIGYYQPYKNGYFRLFARHFNRDSVSGYTANKVFNANQLAIKYGFSNDNLQTELTALLDERYNKTTIGFSIESFYKLSKQLTLAGEVTKNANAMASQNMMMFGKKDAVTAQLFYNPTYRETISAQVSYQKFESLLGEEIADNLSVSIRAQETLFLNDPTWSVYVHYVYEKADKKTQPFMALGKMLDIKMPIYANEFIADKYQQLSIGQRLSNGNVGIPGIMHAKTSYWLDTSVGYNFEEKQLVIDVETGFGLPIFGNDELYASALWQSLDQTGDKNVNLSLGYYLTF